MVNGYTIQIFVGDINDALVWYTNIIGRDPDATPFEDYLEWEIIPDLWLQISEKKIDNSQSQSGRMRFGVSDIESERARIIRELKAEATKVEEIPGTVKWCNFNDPWSNRLGFFQDLKKFPVKHDFDMEFR